MVDFNKVLPLARTVAFGAVCLFSLITFCLSAHIISLTNAYRRGAYYHFTALSLASSILSLISLPALYVISNKRRGAVTSFVAAEIAWLWFLWILWISSAGSTAAMYWISYCTGGVCSEAQAIEAFGFLNWLALMFYTLTLIVLAIMAHLRGHTNVWRSEVLHFDWSAPAVNKGFAGGVVAPEKHFTGTTVQSEVTYQTQVTQPYSVGTVNTVGSPALPQQYPPQQPQYPQPQQQQVFVGAPTGGMPQSPQV
ncbi:hypothetical protein H1R20_g6410, partial [Candolleomyces eurysporus]